MVHMQFRGFRLASIVYLATFIWAVFLSVGLAVFLDGYSQTVTDRALDRAIQVRALSAGMDLGRAIDMDWEELLHLKSRLPTGSPNLMRALFDGIVGDASRVAWIGYVGNDGRVIAASGGLLEGVDASESPWFRGGLTTQYAGDVRNSVLLNRLLGGTDEHPIQFLDLAVPVTNEIGATTGVLAAHINVSWARSYLKDSASVRGIDLFLVNPAGEVVIGSTEAPAQPLELQTFRAAATAVMTSIRETWPDGRSYQSSIIPSVSFGNLPSFGWRLVGRIRADAFAADRSDLIFVGAQFVLGAFSLTLLGAFIFVNLFVMPLQKMAETATAISLSEDIYPPETDSTQEAAKLSAALTRIQTRLHIPSDQDLSPPG